MVADLQFGPNFSVITKVTNSCNLGCLYCYASKCPQTETMSEETLERLLEETAKLPLRGRGRRNVEFIWHGGEPLMRGPEFYENISYIQHWLSLEHPVRFFNSIQTNGTLLSEEMINTCVKHKISVGFSIDGISRTHNEMRPFVNGSNSFDSAFGALKRAKKAGIGGGAIVVLTKRTAEELDNIYDFFKEEKAGLKLNPLILSGGACDHPEIVLHPADYAQVMCDLFDRYISDSDCPIDIDPFDNIMGNILRGSAMGSCQFKENCQTSFISVNVRGDVYPCARFDGEEELKYGNINESSLGEILISGIRMKLLGRSPMIDPTCRECNYKSICNGGCMNNATARNGSPMERDYYCGANKKIFNHIEQRLRTELLGARL